MKAYLGDIDLSDIIQLEQELNSFDQFDRAEALLGLSMRAQAGEIETVSRTKEINLHFHTFFSYNAEGWSPSRIAWESKKRGLYAAGIVDFDVLDGIEEFLAAGEILDLRTTASIESRVFISEYFDKVINSPNEPGISYFMISGCYRQPTPGSLEHDTIRLMREMAERRNTQVVERVNAYLGKVQLDYEIDVIPLTPSGNATERHLVAAYDSKARQVFAGNDSALAEFWSDKLGMDLSKINGLILDTPKFHEAIRGKLMKFGGVGYVVPAPGSFPSVEEVIQAAFGLGAIPTATWLDGTNPGEADMPAMLGLLATKGVAALNIIPDRNWNISNPDEKAVKIDNLTKVIDAARKADFPIIIGTEMNKSGLPFVDDFSAPELQPYIEDFIYGANFLWGHTLLSRTADMGFSSDWARHYFGDDRPAKNKFYATVGSLISPREARLINGPSFRTGSPDDVLHTLQR